METAGYLMLWCLVREELSFVQFDHCLLLYYVRYLRPVVVGLCKRRLLLKHLKDSVYVGVVQLILFSFRLLVVGCLDYDLQQPLYLY